MHSRSTRPPDGGDHRAHRFHYSTFVRDIEAIQFHDNTVIVMGSEKLTPVNESPFAGQTLHRRLTHFWMLRNGEWRLTARHANVVCPS